MCVLPNLALLEIKGLPKLTSLTPHLAHCRSLLVLRLDPEYLVSPPPEEAQRGTRVIMAYLRCRLRGSTPYRHIKLVLMGEKGTGKTTLFSQFQGSSSRADGSTPHMDMAMFDYPPRLKSRRDRPRVTFHVVDFAGDHTYQCIHKCFLTYRSIYLCLWDVTDGKEGLRALLPWLRTIQACVPRSSVILVATHADQRPGLSGNTILQWEEEVLGNVTQLRSSSYAAKLGLPPILQSVVLDTLRKEDVDMLLNDVYDIALQMKQSRSRSPLLEEMVPRSYQELQSLVEVKVRSLCINNKTAPVLRRDEFMDYVRSLTLHNPNDLEEDEEEFDLACNFLHETGVIVHFKSQVTGISDLYFLDPQWLFNTLATIIREWTKGEVPNPVIKSGDLPRVFQSADIPPSLYNSFLVMLESFDIIVSLDFEKETFLVPSLLPQTPPDHYPTYNLFQMDSNLITQYIQFDYLPSALFSQLISRVILYIRQLSGQLLAIDFAASSDTSSDDVAIDDVDGGFPSRMYNSLTAPIRSLVKRSQSFYLDSKGYVVHDDLADNRQLGDKIWALSTANLLATPTTRHRSLTQKLVEISTPLLQQRVSMTPPPSVTHSVSRSLSHVDDFASYIFWKNGLYVEFPCGTKFWMEACASAVALVISGEVVPRVKVLSFLTSSIDALVEECYSGLEATSYSPCPTCLQRFWKETSTEQTNLTFALSTLEMSYSAVTVNEFKETISFSRRPSTSSGLSRSFSGSQFVLSRSPSPTSPGSDETPNVAVLENTLTLFPLATTVQQSLIASTILCPKCETRTSLQATSPHVLLVDFKDTLLLKSKLLEFEEDNASRLGSGGYGKVRWSLYV